MAYNLLARAYNLEAMASQPRSDNSVASNLIAMAYNLEAMASNLIWPPT